ncbi:MAG TPA: ubiquitin-like domain-containing protein [Anaerolineales bacterium]|nr:ubiquitin-like domain-containing protein [Anaerolineales bacterium]
MKKCFWLFTLLLVALCACQSTGASVTILADGHTYSISTNDHSPAQMLAAAKLTLGPNDRILYLGAPVPLNTALPEARSYTLSIRRSIALTLITPAGQKTIQTSAQSVGQALVEDGYTLYTADRFDPPSDTPILGPLTVTYQPSEMLQVSVDGKQFQIRSAAPTIGQALAEAGFPLVGLDTSTPSETDPLPADGKIKVTRVFESVALIQKSIPYATRTEPSADLELDQQAMLQGGQPGLSVTRVRTTSEDGVQVSQKSESASIVRPPQDRIMGYGTKIVIRTAVVDGVTIQYYRALKLLATSYSPCRSGTTKCMNGTSSGLPVQRGTVAMVYSWYLAFGFDKLYIPGYGYATVGDVGAGPNGSHYWVDLGFTDADYQPIYGYVTVYFLAPVPANLVTVLP